MNDSDDLLLKNYMLKNDYKFKAEAIRALMVLGKTSDLEEEHVSMIRQIVKEDLDYALIKYNQRIKGILYKGGKLASYSTYLLVGALRELIPSAKKKNIQILYEKASKYTIEEIKRKE